MLVIAFIFIIGGIILILTGVTQKAEVKYFSVATGNLAGAIGVLLLLFIYKFSTRLGYVSIYDDLSKMEKIDIFLDEHRTISKIILILLISYFFLSLAFVITSFVLKYISNIFYSSAIAGGFWGSIISQILLIGNRIQERTEKYESRVYLLTCIGLLVAIVFCLWLFTIIPSL